MPLLNTNNIDKIKILYHNQEENYTELYIQYKFFWTSYKKVYRKYTKEIVINNKIMEDTEYFEVYNNGYLRKLGFFERNDIQSYFILI